eukprot:COSAG01_NODE_68236_length_264_cov_1.848485_1_plen_51_part_01
MFYWQTLEGGCSGVAFRGVPTCNHVQPAWAGPRSVTLQSLQLYSRHHQSKW